MRYNFNVKKSFIIHIKYLQLNAIAENEIKKHLTLVYQQAH